MSTKNNTAQIVIKGGEYIMPRAAKPNLSSRPKPAPKPRVSATPARTAA